MSIIDNKIKHIAITRIDAMGDVILTLPVCIYLKLIVPDIIITVVGRSYTQPLINSCTAVDHFINYDELEALPKNEQIEVIKQKKIDVIVHQFSNKKITVLARQAGIKIRIGRRVKLYNYINCNRLVRLKRKNSDLHEAQQMVYLLRPLGGIHVPTIGTIANLYEDNFKSNTELPPTLNLYLDKDKFNLIIHPKSNGHGYEWAMDNFTKLIQELPKEKFNIIITGSASEHLFFKTWIPLLPDHVIDLSGKMTLNELIAFVAKADGLLASGTGPLHLAAALGIHTLGLFPAEPRAINAIRWAPLGKKAEHIECYYNDLSSITVDVVFKKITGWLQK